MIPVLFQTITEGTVPQNFGIGPLTDTLSASIKEVRNNEYELALEYAAEGIHAESIAPLTIIKAKPNYTDDPQLFEVYKVGKVMNGRFTVNARHISYRLSNKLITTGTANTCVAACSLLNAQAGAFTVNTDKTSTGNFSIYEPASVRSYFGGKSGSLLDVYGGEWKYDNFTASLKNARGMDRGVTIRYAKNLTQLSQEISIDNLATAILPFYKDTDGNVTTGAKINTGLTLDAPRELAVDFSQDVDPESATPISTQLANLGARYISNNNFTIAFNSITLDFQQLEGLTERVDLCDTVHIYFEALGISATAKCVATTWDVLQDRYTACTFGDARTSIADTIATQTKELSQTASRSYLAESVNRATALISGNLGGYVVLHDADGDGEPDEILVMDKATIATATKVWRWNKSGLGYSSGGYAGPYGLAMTSAGEIVADYITTGTLNGNKATITNINASNINTGTLNANLIKAGTIQDTQGNSSINMTTGAATLNDLKAKNSFYLIDSGGTARGSLTYSSGGGTSIFLYNPSGTMTATLQARATGSGGHFQLYNNSSTGVFVIQANSAGGGAYSYNNSGTLVCSLASASGQDGTINVNNSSGTNTINLSGQSGNVRCVSVTQTSSRKVKDNIKPIEDAARILELNAVQFDYKDKTQGVNRRGFIAEDVAEILPDLVTPEIEADGITYPASLDYVQMIPYLQQIIKEHETKIKELEKAVEELKKART